MTIYNGVNLIGSQTTDLIYHNSDVFITQGGIANVARNLEVDFNYIPCHFSIVDINQGKNLGMCDESYIDLSDYVTNSHWTHIAYIDWFDASPYVKSQITTADIAETDPVKLMEFNKKFTYRDKINILFCTTEQSKYIAHHNKFIHNKEKWLYDSKVYYTLPIDLDFTLGAGDTLVASIINNCVGDIKELPYKLDVIEDELVKRLIEREMWLDRLSRPY